MEQGNAIQLSVVHFLSAYNRCANGCTAADEQQGNPQCKVTVVTGLWRIGIVFRFAVVTGLWRFRIVFQLRRYDVGFFDFLCTVLVAEILATAFAVPVLDVAVGGRGGVHLGHMAQVAVFGGVHVTIGSQADVALGLVHAGGRAAGVSIADDGAVTVHGALQGDQAVVGQGDVGGNSQSSAGGNSQLHITLHGHIAWDAGIADDLADLFVEEHTVSNAVGIAVKGLGTGGIDPAADDLHAICGTYAMVIEMSLSVNDAVVQRDCIPGKNGCIIRTNSLDGAVGNGHTGIAKQRRIIARGLHGGVVANIDGSITIHAIAVFALNNELAAIDGKPAPSRDSLSIGRGLEDGVVLQGQGVGYAVSLSKLQDRIIAAAGVGDLGGTGQLAVAFPLAAFSARQVDIDGGVLNVQGARIVGSGGLGHTHILHVQRTGAGDGQASGVYTLDGIDGTSRHFDNQLRTGGIVNRHTTIDGRIVKTNMVRLRLSRCTSARNQNLSVGSPGQLVDPVFRPENNGICVDLIIRVIIGLGRTHVQLHNWQIVGRCRHSQHTKHHT
jgi:hypothetical protein